MTRLVGIFGYPLSHSLSPAIQQAAFDYHNIDAVYQAWQTPPEELGSGVAKLREDQYLGANVTIPHKVKVMQHLDRIDRMAADIGAVNTIVKEDGELVGYNTDAYGFIKSLKDCSGLDPRGKRALLLGAGGAAAMRGSVLRPRSERAEGGPEGQLGKDTAGPGGGLVGQHHSGQQVAGCRQDGGGRRITGRLDSEDDQGVSG